MSKQTKPVCVAHRCEMRVEKNDTRVLFNADFGPYQVQSGDMWACPVGNERVVVGWGDGALAQHFEPDFEAFLTDIDVAVPA